MVLLDSRCSKDSNGISFAKFWVTNQKIWIIKVLDEIWFNFCFNNLFESGKATRRVLVGGYRFVWIGNEDCRIKRERNAPDLRIPLRVSDLILATRSGSNGRRQRGEGSPGKHIDGEVRRVWRSTMSCSGGLLALGKSGRGVGCCGEDWSKIGGVNFFLERCRDPAGAASGRGGLQRSMASVSGWESRRKKGVRGSARSRWCRGSPNRDDGLTDSVDIERRRWRKLRAPVRNFSLARRRFCEGAKGDGGGECGFYIGTEDRQLR
jgi:hypothetical protein